MIYLDTSVAIGLFVPEAKTANIEAWFAARADPLSHLPIILAISIGLTQES